MNMKKLILTSILAVLLPSFCLSNLNAQEKKITFGVKAGLNLSNMHGDGESGDAKLGFNVGATVDVALTPDWFFRTGLELTTKGLKENGEITLDGDQYFDADVTFNPMYLQVPIHIGYGLDVSETARLSFFAGPYLAYGVGGKVKIKEKSSGVEISNNIFQSGAMKEFDLGLGGGIGLDINSKIALTLGVDFGLANVSDAGGTIKNRNGYLSVGYKF